jgi:hypothetical protein
VSTKISVVDEDGDPALDISQIPRLARRSAKLSALVSRRRALSIKREEMDEQIGDLNRQLLVQLAKADVMKCRVDGHHLSRRRSTRRTLSRLKLVEEGVDLDIIERCTETTIGEEYLHIQPPRAPK